MNWLSKKTSCCMRYMRHHKKVIFLVLFILTGMMAYLTVEGLVTKEKNPVQATESAIQIAENAPKLVFSLDESGNPLKVNENPKITHAVRAYYDNSQKKKQYIEYYQNHSIYTKHGKYPNSYIVFVAYDMKIKDVYTMLPGLEVLYVVPTIKQDYKAYSIGKSSEMEKSVLEMEQHKDVQELMQSVDTRYQKAISSDWILKESVNHLMEALSDK